MVKRIVLDIPDAEAPDVARYIAALEHGTAEKAVRCVSAIMAVRSCTIKDGDGGFSYRVVEKK